MMLGSKGTLFMLKEQNKQSKIYISFDFTEKCAKNSDSYIDAECIQILN